jgi:hypothetical protein
MGKSERRHINSVEQMCVIITEAKEEDDGRDNTIINVQGGNPGRNHRKEMEKVYISTGEWKMIMSAINHDTVILMDSIREVLMGYQYALHQHKKKLLEERSELRRSQESNSTSSRPRWEEYNKTLESSEERHRWPKHNRRRTEWPRKEDHTKNLNSFLSDEEEDFMQDTPEAALVAAQAYLLTTQLKPGDPRENIHQVAIKSLGLVKDELKQKSLGKESIHHEQTVKRSQKSQSPRTQRSSSPGRGNHKAEREDARNIITQARVNKSRYACDEVNYEDEEK